MANLFDLCRRVWGVGKWELGCGVWGVGEWEVGSGEVEHLAEISLNP
ncbi:hypothetical protein [Microcystis aeruginosa]|nr:hypothetical protein [Microcystis aeruginosa]